MRGYWVRKQGTAVDYYTTMASALNKRDYLNSLNSVRWYSVYDETGAEVEWPVGTEGVA